MGLFSSGMFCLGTFSSGTFCLGTFSSGTASSESGMREIISITVSSGMLCQNI